MDIKIGLIIPDRGDRPELLANCHRMIQRQTLKPFLISLVDNWVIPPSSDIDITTRYKHGYDTLRNQNLDLISFWENDDFYAPNYLEYWASKWLEYGKPDLLGSNFTVYYHIKLKKYFTFHHETRSSMMNTFIKPDLTLDWGRNDDPYTDVHLWNLTRTAGFDGGPATLKGIIVQPPILSIGIKHGVGLCGGTGHSSEAKIINGRLANDRLNRYVNEDNGFLEKTTDLESYKFYNDYSDTLPEIK